MSSSWRYWTGDLGAPGTDWRLSSFVEPIGWITGQTSIGYGDSDDNTELSTMEDNFSTVYLRHEFSIPTGAVPSLLHLRLYVDDGAIVWINGVEVVRTTNVSAPEPGPAATASSAISNATWQDYFIPGSGDIVVEGSNVIAVHALNASASSSDFSIDVELARPRLDFGQVEATSSNNFLPNPSPNGSPSLGFEFQGSGDFTSKTFEIRTVTGGVGFATSNHARNVATYSYRSSAMPGFFLSHIKSWEAGDYISDGILNSGTTPPSPSFTHVQNHSWIADETEITNSELNNYIRRFDYIAARDGILCAIGLNNSSDEDVPQLWGSAYNAISVGRTDGLHSRGGTVAGVDGSGRLKPDIVAPGSGSATSYSTANVSGCAALLLGHAYTHPELSNIFHPEVNKAILMAGAVKADGWSHSTSQPLDPIYGVGTLNVFNSFNILVAGEQTAGDPPVPTPGWDYATIGATGTANYSFTIPADHQLNECSVVLTWFRQFEDDPADSDFAAMPTLPDFELRLYASQGGTLGALLDSSDSAVDNVEHIFARGLPPGEYTITVESDIPSSYAIAWDNRNSNPEVVINSIDQGAGTVSVEVIGLAVGEKYILQHSFDLINWTNIYFFDAEEPTEPFTQAGLSTTTRLGFYRILWNN